LERYALLLQRVLAAPDSPLPHISLWEETEQQQVLLDWNRSERSYSLERCTHEIFERQVQCDPHASAVAYEGVRLSYAELNARANQLARYLSEMGVGPEVRVGICMDRSLDLIVALLGILKAGGAYVQSTRLFHRSALVSSWKTLKFQFCLPPSNTEIVCLHSGSRQSAWIPSGIHWLD